jgi:tetratricopeptide (TPR) repeat protein
MSAKRIRFALQAASVLAVANALHAQSVDSVRALVAVGKYDQAEAISRRAPGAEYANILGEILIARGRRVAAESAFVRSVSSHAADSLTAALNLAVLHFDRGDVTQAMAEFDHFITVYNASAATLTSRELAAVAAACRYLGAINPQLFKDALKAFDRALEIDPTNFDARNALGELFLEKYNGADEQKSFAEVLDVDPKNARALLGAARRMEFDGVPGADSLVELALAVNPSYVDAHVERARMFVDLEQFTDAQHEIDRALAVNPASIGALAVGAAIKYVTGDQSGYDEFRRRALVLNPHDASFFATMAEMAGRVRQYAAAAAFAAEGIALDSSSAKAHGLRGMNLLRLGEYTGARKELEVAFKGDPYDVWIKNTLDLMDTYPNYDVIVTSHARVMIEKTESKLLSIYLDDLIERAYTTFADRYAYTPPLPLHIEVYRSHADFSVRTVGLAGIGALGVSFGSTLAFDSPAAKDAGPFNWGSTMWHEIAHTFTLGMTDHRIPRWFSEGLSVWEEHQGKQGWGFHADPGFLQAFKDGKLVLVSKMNDGFMRPAYPEQLEYSYYQASLVCDLIVRERGVKGLVAMLGEYKAGHSTDEVFQRVLGSDTKALDKRFDAFVREKFAGPLAGLDKYVELMRLGDSAADRGMASDAQEAFESAVQIFPEYAGSESPYTPLAKIYIAKGEFQKARDALMKIVLQNETDYPAHVTLAALLAQLGDTSGAAGILDRAMYINPFDIAVHQQLAGYFSATHELKGAVRERAAIVALEPVDRADALYQLAVAQHDAGDDVGAKTSVLHALEDAPNFAKAQELLLLIVDKPTP